MLFFQLLHILHYFRERSVLIDKNIKEKMKYDDVVMTSLQNFCEEELNFFFHSIFRILRKISFFSFFSLIFGVFYPLVLFYTKYNILLCVNISFIFSMLNLLPVSMCFLSFFLYNWKKFEFLHSSSYSCSRSTKVLRYFSFCIFSAQQIQLLFPPQWVF